jgi:hypothetical protein
MRATQLLFWHVRRRCLCGDGSRRFVGRCCTDSPATTRPYKTHSHESHTILLHLPILAPREADVSSVHPEDLISDWILLDPLQATGNCWSVSCGSRRVMVNVWWWWWPWWIQYDTCIMVESVGCWVKSVSLMLDFGFWIPICIQRVTKMSGLNEL